MASQIWNPKMECMDRRQMEALQLERLRELVDYCDRNVEFYHKRLSEPFIFRLHILLYTPKVWKGYYDF